jgi:hypothetical protein
MIDKHSRQVAYAVMSFGGFLGIGESYHPLPWRTLTYDTRKGGYIVDIDRTRLETAPSYTPSTALRPTGPTGTMATASTTFMGCRRTAYEQKAPESNFGRLVK